MATAYFEGLEGDVRVDGDTIIVTYYNAPDADRLREHYEDLPAKLRAEKIDPRVPWLYGFHRLLPLPLTSNKPTPKNRWQGEKETRALGANTPNPWTPADWWCHVHSPRTPRLLVVERKPGPWGQHPYPLYKVKF